MNFESKLRAGQSGPDVDFALPRPFAVVRHDLKDVVDGGVNAFGCQDRPGSGPVNRNTSDRAWRDGVRHTSLRDVR